ncbi:uncharacterized protein LOC135488790 isoform X2 [Lineus longissimus]|uniref:uncharacterized protein LOC135488790 isoform X2 n=1 Tax=Lineus longissimus TaxID=88925 RepID=UPI002B4DCE4E
MALVATPMIGPELIAPSMPAPRQLILPPSMPVIQDVHEEKTKTDSVVKFRWNRTYLTHSKEVLLEGDFLEGKPLPLRWNDRLELYESEQTKVPCDHHICLLRINGDLLLLDSFEVNCYTFEVNLSLREEFDVTPEPECIENIADSIQAKASSLSISSAHSNISMEDLDESRDDEMTHSAGSGSIKLSGRYKDLVQKQMRMSGNESDSSERSMSQHVNGKYEEVGYSTMSVTSTSRLKSSFRGQSDGMLHASSKGISLSQDADRLSTSSYNRPPSRRSNFSDTKTDSRLSNYSKSSEQELNSYFENSRKTTLMSVRPSLPVWGTSDRPSSTNSMLSATQQFPPIDHRSLTPEMHHTSQPSIMSPLRTMRAAPVSSGNSSRTVTPVVAYDPFEHNSGASRYHELEETLLSQKHTLDDKESEIRSLHSDVSDLRSENRMLNNQLRDMERRQEVNHNGDDSYNRLLAEKENLATELYKMRNQRNLNGQRNRDSVSIDCYDPDNPEVLKEKLADLQSQVQDLQEASESASSELNRAERRINELVQDNENLQTLGGVSVEDIQAENQYLRQQVERLNERNSKLLNDSDTRGRDEMQAMRSDVRTLRDRNQQVNEDNMRLREELRDLRQRSDESLRKLRRSAPSPKFHDTTTGSGGYRSGHDDTSGRYRGGLDDFVPGYSGHTSPPRSSSKISDEHEQYNPMLTDRSDSTAYLTSSMHTKDYIDNELSDNEVELSDQYLRRTRSKSPRPSDGFKSSPSSNSRHKASPSYYVDDVSPSRKHRYSNHFDDDTSSTSSILSEVERELMLISGGSSSRRHNRSRSFEPKKSRGSASDRDARVLSPAGFRSCTPPPTVTQANKAALGFPTKKSILSTTGKRPFAPRSPGDIPIGAVVKFSRQNGKISKGLVRYIGHLPGRHDTYLGLELENEAGKHDGMYNNERYFTCKPNKGVFVVFNKIVMCWA